MSKCTVIIEVNGHLMEIDPYSDLNSNEVNPLTKLLSPDQLRTLYAGLKESIDLEKVISPTDDVLVNKGETVYEAAVGKLGSKTFWPTPFAILKTLTDPDEIKAVRAYIAAQKTDEPVEAGNYLIDAKDAHKASPYSIQDISDLVFKGEASSYDSLFHRLMSIPGMETVRISIAFASSFPNEEKFNKPKGVYISSDNIIQITLPDTWLVRRSTKDGMRDSIKDISKKRDTLAKIVLHEVTHAVYSELYNSNPAFRTAFKALYDQYIVHVTEKYKSKPLPAKLRPYDDIHEFIADIFLNPVLHKELGKILSDGAKFDEHLDNSFYDFMVRNLPSDVAMESTMLQDILRLVTYSTPAYELRVLPGTETKEALERDYQQNLYFHTGLNAENDGKNTAPTNGYDSRHYNDSRADWIRQQFEKRSDSETYNPRDVYYMPLDREINDFKIDTASAHDLALIPWIKWDAAKKEWYEVGVLNDGKKDILENGKPKVVPLLRGEDDKPLPHKEGDVEYKVNPRTTYLPIVYSNAKKERLVVSKVGENITGSKSISIPYNLIKGIRKLNKEYFDHNHNFQKDLEDAKSIRAAIALKYANEAEEAVADRLRQADDNIDTINSQIKKSEDIKADMIGLYNTYMYKRELEDGSVMFNVPQTDYVNSGRKLEPNMHFVNDDKSIYKYYFDTQGGSHMNLNYNRFSVLWDKDIAKSFALSSENIAEAVGKGDLVRVKSKGFKDEHGKVIKLEGHEWLPVYGRVANGIMVATKAGKGLVVPFNDIEGYAIDKTASNYEKLKAKYKEAQDTFKDNIYEVEDGDKWKFKGENVRFKSMTFSEKFNKREDEELDEAITRFGKNLDLIKKRIVPGSSFVKVRREFSFKGEAGWETKEYDLMELVIAKADTGVYTFREKDGKYIYSFVPYDSNFKKDKAELKFLMEDLSEVKELYDEYEKESDTFSENWDKQAFKNKGTEEEPELVSGNSELQALIKANPDATIGSLYKQYYKNNPRSFKEAYDVFENPNSKDISRLVKGDVVAIKIEKKEGKTYKTDTYYRKVLRVTPDGMVVVADKTKEDVTYEKTGYVKKAGYYARYVEAENIMKVGYNIGNITLEDGKYIGERHQEIINRRAFILDKFNADFKYDNFSYMKAEFAKKRTEESIERLKAKASPEKEWNYRYIPLTDKILTPKEDIKEASFLNRDKKPVTNEDDAAWVGAWFKGDKLWSVDRGINAKATYYKASDFTMTVDGKTRLKPGLSDLMSPGDSIVTQYKNKEGKMSSWTSVIDRVDANSIYIINADLSVRAMPLDKITGFRMSTHNDMLTGWKRKNKVEKLVGKWKQKAKATVDASLVADFKSPADSRRSLYEIGNRLKAINPDVKLNFVSSLETNSLLKDTGFDYGNVRAFVLNGEVNINVDKASVSDVIHEYAHLFLHTLKYDNPAMYEAIVESAKSHELLTDIAKIYPHLSGSDLYEEVFVTLLGEQIGRNAKNFDNSIVDGFSSYTGNKVTQLVDGTFTKTFADLGVKDVLRMSLENIINLVGDEVMNNRISSKYESAEFKFSKDIKQLKADLMKLGLVTKMCHG